MLAWAYLSRVAEAPCAELVGLIKGVGPVEAAERIRRAAVDEALAKRTDARREIDCAAEDLETLRRRDGRLITPEDDEWPGLAFASFRGAPVRAARVSGPSCQRVPSGSSRKRPTRSEAVMSSLQATVIRGRSRRCAMNSMNRDLPQPVGPFTITGRRAA